VLNYQLYFNQKLISFVILLVIGIIVVIFFWVDNAYFDKSSFYENNTYAKITTRLSLTVLVIIFFFIGVLPIIKDKKTIDSNNFYKLNGKIYHGVNSGGRYGLSKTVTIESDGELYRFRVVYIEEGLSLNDEVKVTYLENSRYAVIESRKK